MTGTRSDRERGIASGEAPSVDGGNTGGKSFLSPVLAIASPGEPTERAEASRRSDRCGEVQLAFDFRQVVVERNHWGEIYHVMYDDGYSALDGWFLTRRCAVEAARRAGFTVQGGDVGKGA